MADDTAKKQRGKPFPPGKSGNPTGRPRGVRNRVTTAAQSLLDGEAEALTRKAVELALAGNVYALRLCLERLLPPKKERAVSVKLPAIEKVEDLPKLTEALIAAVASGELLPGEAAGLSSLAANHAKALELTEIEKRISTLEKKK